MEEEKLTIKTESGDNGSVKKLYVGDNKQAAFTVSATFTDEQITEVYHLCHQFFGAGVREGVVKVQSDLRRILGIA